MQIILFLECPPTLGGERRFFCPSKTENNEWMCVTLGQLCNTKPDCPEGEDENDTMCLFHRPVSIHTPTLEYTSNQLHECYYCLLLPKRDAFCTTCFPNFLTDFSFHFQKKTERKTLVNSLAPTTLFHMHSK